MAKPKYEPPFVRSALNYDRDEASNAAGIDVSGEPSLTVQSDRDEADINVLVKRFGVTGHLPTSTRPMMYGDFDTVIDFHTAQNAIREATENFMSMPADLRAKFKNNPQEFLEFCENPDNQDELIKLGLAKRREVSDNDDVPRGTSYKVDDNGKASSGRKDDAGKGVGKGAKASSGSDEAGE